MKYSENYRTSKSGQYVPYYGQYRPYKNQKRAKQ